METLASLGIRSLVVALALLACLSSASAGRFGGRREAMRRHLKRLNKTPVNSIKSPDGDIIDCVHISDQPAFDHPFLKNHTVQMRPSSHPEGLFDENKVASQKRTPSVSQLWHQNGRCPDDTIPIRRTTRDDVLRASSLKRYGKKKHRTVPNPLSADPDQPNDCDSDHEYAYVYVQGDKYYGAKATINLWQPKVVKSDEFSLSQFWIVGGSGQDLNTIEAGWQVYPGLYRDNNTRLFIYWTRDGYQKTGCYNLLCSGFVQTNTAIAIGGTIVSPISSYDGPQYDISILAWKDPKGGNWWMRYGSDDVGYWPSSLFSHLADSASAVEWGGEVVNSQPAGEHTSTEMGSGHFSEEGYSKASYFRNIQIVDRSNNLKTPTEIVAAAEKPNCYNVQNGNNSEWGEYFYYGGPGRNAHCP